MKVIDCRSGEVMVPSKSVVYGDGEKLKLIEVDSRLFGPTRVDRDDAGPS